jgi:gamma-glutamyl phosphate reductase
VITTTNTDYPTYTKNDVETVYIVSYEYFTEEITTNSTNVTMNTTQIIFEYTPDIEFDLSTLYTINSNKELVLFSSSDTTKSFSLSDYIDFISLE